MAIFTSEELIAPMGGIEKSKADVRRLIIKDSSWMYIPDNIFNNTGIKGVIMLTKLQQKNKNKN